LGLVYLSESGLISCFPELLALAHTPQSRVFHPEGTAWNHTVLTVEAMARLSMPPDMDRGLMVMAALVHDLGKPLTTVRGPSGHLTSKGHAQAGLPVVRSFLDSIRAPLRLGQVLERLTRTHMDLAFQPLSPKALRRLARRLGPDCHLGHFWALAAADWNGRKPWPEPYPYALEDFLDNTGGELRAQPLPVRGDEIMAALGLSQGAEVGRAKSLIAEALDDGLIEGPEEALAYAREMLQRV
jgi:tRNA nucleotidyltransferase (CCA-adding enzyme)